MTPISYSQAPAIVKEYINLCFFHSPDQFIMEPTRATDHTKTLVDLILTNSPECITQSGVIEMRLSAQELIYCSRKTSPLKLNKY